MLVQCACQSVCFFRPVVLGGGEKVLLAHLVSCLMYLGGKVVSVGCVGSCSGGGVMWNSGGQGGVRELWGVGVDGVLLVLSCHFWLGCLKLGL